jgi:hypothetical protein
MARDYACLKGVFHIYFGCGSYRFFRGRWQAGCYSFLYNVSEKVQDSMIWRLFIFVGFIRVWPRHIIVHSVLISGK